MNELINGVNGKTEKSALLYDKIVHLNYGDTLLHSDISELIEVPRKSPLYYGIINKTRKLLLKVGKLLKTLQGQGYTIAAPGEYADAALDKIKGGLRKVSHGYEILEVAPTQDMSKAELDEFSLISGKAKMLHASMHGTIVEMKLLKRKSMINIR